MTASRARNVSFPLGSSLDFLKRLWRLNHALEQLSSRMEKRFGVTAQQRFLLRCVGGYPGITAGQLADLLHLDPGTVSATLTRLEAKRLVARRRDPNDKRRASLTVTALGRSFDKPVAGTVEHAVDTLLRKTTRAQQRTTVELIEELGSLLDAQLPSRKRKRKR